MGLKVSGVSDTYVPPCTCPIPMFHTATQYWHNLVASVAHKFQDSGVQFAIANEEDYPDDLR